jgi:hypothetical protein
VVVPCSRYRCLSLYVSSCMYHWPLYFMPLYQPQTLVIITIYLAAKFLSLMESLAFVVVFCLLVLVEEQNPALGPLGCTPSVSKKKKIWSWVGVLPVSRKKYHHEVLKARIQYRHEVGSNFFKFITRFIKDICIFK